MASRFIRRATHHQCCTGEEIRHSSWRGYRPTSDWHCVLLCRTIWKKTLKTEFFWKHLESCKAFQSCYGLQFTEPSPWPWFYFFIDTRDWKDLTKDWPYIWSKPSQNLTITILNVIETVSGIMSEWVIWSIVFLFCRLGHSDVFNLIDQHNLFNSIQDKIIMLMEFDKEVEVMASIRASFDSGIRMLLTHKSDGFCTFKNRITKMALPSLLNAYWFLFLLFDRKPWRCWLKTSTKFP